MNRTELNTNWVEAILFYCYQTNNTVFFDEWATQCGQWAFDLDNNLYIETWFLDTIEYNIPQPLIATLLEYTVQDVTSFHDAYYTYVSNIISSNQSSYYFLSTSQIASIPVSRLNNTGCEGFRVFDTTVKRVKYFNGTEWIES